MTIKASYRTNLYLIVKYYKEGKKVKLQISTMSQSDGGVFYYEQNNSHGR